MAIAGYNIYKNGVKQNGNLVVGLSYALTSLIGNTNVDDITIKSVDDLGAESTTFTYPTFLTLPPQVTNLVSTVLSTTEIDLAWDASGSTGNVTYTVFRGTVSGSLTSIVTGLTSPSYSDTGLTDDTEYFYQVQAINATGSGVISAEVSDITLQIVNYIYDSNLDPKNRFIDIELSRSAWGNDTQSTPITTAAFTLVLTTNGGAVSTVTIDAVSQLDAENSVDASVLIGGDSLIRVFISPDVYPDGIESINVFLVPTNAFDIQGNAINGNTGEVLLSPLPYAVMGNDYMWWDASDGAYTEGIADKGLSVQTITYATGQEATMGSDADGNYIELNSSKGIIDDSNTFSKFDDSYLWFANHKYLGDINTPANQGNIFDISGERSLFTYPYGTQTKWGTIMAGSPNGNLVTTAATLTNNFETLRVNLQNGSNQEGFKNGVSQGSTSAYVPYRQLGGGTFGNNSGGAQHYRGKLYSVIIIKGLYTTNEINTLQTYFESL